MRNPVIGFMGAGNMARAMMKALGKERAMLAADRESKALAKASGLGAKPASAGKLAVESDIIVLAVKPQNAAEAAEAIRGPALKGKLIISILAGTTIAKLKKIFGAGPVFARVMPNTPVLAGEGACGYSFGPGCAASHKLAVKNILSRCCRVAIEVPESKINAVTALSGSGPAYFFYFAEAMTKAGEKLGIRREEALKLVAQTIKGAGEMMLSSGETPALLRERVTSKKGTTEAALKSLGKSGADRAMLRAVFAAKKRADELGRER